MHELDLVDETYIAADPARLRELLCDETRWASWFPALVLRCFDDRGERGKRWTVGGALLGTAEIWLEEWAEGTIVHVFVQADPVRGAGWSRARWVRPGARALRRRYAVPLKRLVTAVKDEVEAGRRPGEPPRGLRTRHRPARGSLAHDQTTEPRRAGGATDEEPFDGQPDDE